jgi:hypothetical protein
MPRPQQCPCGSKKYPEANYDARGIFMFYACGVCEKKKLAGYREEVLTDPNYETTEDVEEE